MGFFIALSCRIVVAYRLRKPRLCRLLALGTSVGKNSYQLFCASSPIPFGPKVMEGQIRPTDKKKETHTEPLVQFGFLLCKGYKKDISRKMLTGFELYELLLIK